MTGRTYERNKQAQALACLRCGQSYDLCHEVADLGLGCPTCLDEGYPASLYLEYKPEQSWQVDRAVHGMARYAAHLPYHTFPSLGEGMTPLVELAPPAEVLSLAAPALHINRLWVKNEGQNPTGSHKDRMSALVVARAAALGRKTVVAASSGNAGASLTAYARAAGLCCGIVATTQINPGWAKAIETAGGLVILADSSLERWQSVQELVNESGWYPATNYVNPPVGSNPFGVQGYKTVAYELAEQCGQHTPTMVIVPTSRGDLLWGIWQGFSELAHWGRLPGIPRLVAVEPVPRLSRVLAGEDYRQAFNAEPHAMTSIGGTTATYQSVVALRGSGGIAVEVSTEEAKAAQRELARRGLYAELSAAASLAGLQTLAMDGVLGQSERVVLIVTSHGYKEVPTY